MRPEDAELVKGYIVRHQILARMAPEVRAELICDIAESLAVEAKPGKDDPGYILRGLAANYDEEAWPDAARETVKRAQELARRENEQGSGAEGPSRA